MITKFKLFETDYSDVDPLGEENWNFHGIEDYLTLLKGMNDIEIKHIDFNNIQRNFDFRTYDSEGNELNISIVEFNNDYIQMYCDETERPIGLENCTKEELNNKISKISKRKK
jgi:hypothetical protein